MRQLGDLLVGLFFLTVFAAAGFGVWLAAVPDRATAARDRAVRAAERLTQDDPPGEVREGDSARRVRR